MALNEQEESVRGSVPQMVEQQEATATSSESSLAALRRQVMPSLAAIAIGFAFIGPVPVWPDTVGGGVGGGHRW